MKRFFPNKLFVIATLILAVVFPVSASALTSTQEKEVYTNLRMNFLNAYRTYLEHRPSEKTALTSVKNDRAYVSAVTELLITRMDSIRFFLAENKGLLDDERAMLLAEAQKENSILATIEKRTQDAADIPSLAAAASDLRAYLPTHDSFIKVAAGYLIIGNLELAITAQSNIGADLAEQMTGLEKLGVDVSALSDQITAHDANLTEARTLLDEARTAFRELPDASDTEVAYADAYQKLKSVSDKLQKGSGQVFKSMMMLRNMVTPLRSERN